MQLIEKDLERDKLSVEDYAALSHCWGNPSAEDKDRFCTTAKNYIQRLQGFSLQDLPRTFRDAVYATQSLGFRFLWIDAICIIQTTDPDLHNSDWEKEARLMEEVFRSASFTLSATSATHWEEGFLPPRTILPISQTDKLSKRWRDGLIRVRSLLPERLGVGPWRPLRHNDFQENVDASPLNKRAWVMQERVLSRRVIHFAREYTYWECGEVVRCDDGRDLRWYEYTDI